MIVNVNVPAVFALVVGDTDSTIGAVLTARVTVTLAAAEANPLADKVSVASPAVFARTRNVVELWPAATVTAAGAVAICAFEVAIPTVVATVTAVPIDTVTGELVAPSDSSSVVGVAVKAATPTAAVIPNTTRVVRICPPLAVSVIVRDPVAAPAPTVIRTGTLVADPPEPIVPVTSLPLKVISLAPVRFVPVIVASTVVDCTPVAGEIDAIAGASTGSVTTKSTGFETALLPSVSCTWNLPGTVNCEAGIVTVTRVALSNTVPTRFPLNVPNRSVVRSVPSMVIRTWAEEPAAALAGSIETISGVVVPSTWTEVTDNAAEAEDVMSFPCTSVRELVVIESTDVPGFTGEKVISATFRLLPVGDAVVWKWFSTSVPAVLSAFTVAGFPVNPVAVPPLTAATVTIFGSNPIVTW